MSDELVRVGEVQPRYTSTGRLSSYSIELWHDGLGEHREIKSSDPNVLENKANALLNKWEEKWLVKRGRIAAESSAQDAAAETEAAQAQISGAARLLEASLNVDDRVDWDSLKKHDPFEWDSPQDKKIRYMSGSNAPVSFVPSDRPKEPQLRDFERAVTWFDYLIPGARAKKKEAADQDWLAAMAKYEAECASADEEDRRRRDELERQRKKFLAAEAEFDNDRRDAEEKIDKLREEWTTGNPEATIEHADLVLSNSKYPDWMLVDYSVAFDGASKMMVVDYRLPAPSEIPTLERVSYVKSRGERTEKHLPEAKQKLLFDQICYQVALRTIHELFEADEFNGLTAITFNGWVEAVNPSTGIEERSCVLSVQAQKGEILAFDLAKVDPKACFKNLKGVAASSLAGLAPVRPILVLDTNDRRFVPSRDVAGDLDLSVNLASMPWEDFEHLVRELFSKIFSSNGSEVHVTQASRDGGVDAIALDPDPIKGGKIVIQAKRYSNTVGVSAVRDLYGTVMNEGANRGILVTTLEYGPDAYKFAQGKPLTLLNGSNLLSLLADHGHQARIDLREAKMAGKPS